VSANPGRLRSSRPAYRKSAKSDCMFTSQGRRARNTAVLKGEYL